MTSKLFLSSDGRNLLVDLALREDARELIAEVKGNVVASIDELPSAPAIAVGDRVTISLVEAGLRPSVAVVDLRERRRADPSAIHRLDGYLLLTTRNPPGTILREAWSAVRLAIEVALHGPSVALVVDGEEDLLGFPAVMMAPDGWVVLYGQPGVGLVAVKVNEEVREEARLLLERAFRPA